MAVPRDRIIAGFFAGLFIISSSILTITVIYSIVQSNKKPSNGATSTPAATATNDTATNKEKTTVNENALAGKPLANFTPTPSIPELQEIDTTPGTGDTVKAGDTITADYTGAVAATGTVFQSSLDSGSPVSFSLSQVIAGWSQGVPGMKVGGTRRLLIPAALAYGANPPAGSGIPANADLVFDVTVKAIVKQ
ncbi:MAG: putative peptidyl-prolyl cis-trans isomerase [Candidatus Saccharibacteria bacterium]|nr:putative peptidyl-prolyl cis-trans isomerase [Candidatus Saccharibacteria bacterium]